MVTREESSYLHFGVRRNLPYTIQIYVFPCKTNYPGDLFSSFEIKTQDLPIKFSPIKSTFMILSLSTHQFTNLLVNLPFTNLLLVQSHSIYFKKLQKYSLLLVLLIILRYTTLVSQFLHL